MSRESWMTTGRRFAYKKVQVLGPTNHLEDFLASNTLDEIAITLSIKSTLIWNRLWLPARNQACIQSSYRIIIT
mgnify:CR=1 FL=1